MKYQGKITDPKDLVTKEYVDTGLSGKLGTSGDGSNVTAAFNAASSRTNISTGEKLSVIFGKIAKWFADLGAAAFRGVDSTVTASSTNLVESGAVKSALTDIENDLSAMHITGNTNNTGITIPIGYFFYLNGILVRSLVSIQNGATLTEGTNYGQVTTGALQGIPHFQNVTATTSSAGVFDSGMPFINVISAKIATSGVNYYCMIRPTTAGNATVYVFNGANFSPVANETVTVTLCLVN